MSKIPLNLPAKTWPATAGGGNEREETKLTYKNRSIREQSCVRSAPRSSRCRSPPGDPTTISRTWARMPVVPWSDPAASKEQNHRMKDASNARQRTATIPRPSVLIRKESSNPLTEFPLNIKSHKPQDLQFIDPELEPFYHSSFIQILGKGEKIPVFQNFKQSEVKWLFLKFDLYLLVWVGWRTFFNAQN